MATVKFSVTKLVSERELEFSNHRNLLLTKFSEAYEELRRSCPKGDLAITLTTESDAEASFWSRMANRLWPVDHTGMRVYNPEGRRTLDPLDPAILRWPDGSAV